MTGEWRKDEPGRVKGGGGGSGGWKASPSASALLVRVRKQRHVQYISGVVVALPPQRDWIWAIELGRNIH